MNRTYRDLLKHSGIYGLGHVLNRLTSLILLPIYTRYLTPADYGCIALLDLTIGVLAIFLGSGMVQAVNRFHFLASSERERDAIWWTGLTVLLGMAGAILLPAYCFRQAIADLALGAAQPDGSFFLILALPTLFLNSMGAVLDNYLRVQKWSGTFVLLSFARLCLNAGLNLWFLAGLRLGITGVLVGNLISAGVSLVIGLLLFCSVRGSYTANWPMARALWSFGCPLIITTFLSLVMHQSDRYFLRAYVDMEEVGIYFLAHQIGQGLNSLILVPFAAIWNVSKFEVADDPQADAFYNRVFHVFSTVLLLIMLGVSLFANPLLDIIASPTYASAADIIPIICLGYVFFSLTSFVNLPALLEKKTSRLLPASIISAVVNVAGNMALVPALGMWGAALTTALTFVVYLAVNYQCCRGLRFINYNFKLTAITILAFTGLYLLFQLLFSLQLPWLAYYGLAGGTWLLIACLFLKGRFHSILRLSRNMVSPAN